MITKTKIQALCSPSVYGKGLAIYRQDEGVPVFQVQETSKEALVQAEVQSGSTRRYRVRMKYDKERDFLDSIYCECTAFHKDAGMCRHCVAVLLKYMEYCERKKYLEEYDPGKEKKESKEEREKTLAEQLFIWKKEGGYRFDEYETLVLPKARLFERETSSAVKNLLNKQCISHISPLLDPDIFGKVRLFPYLYRKDEKFHLEFQIGVSRAYVIKDIFEFVWCMKETRDYGYGKQLHFIHVPEAFEELSRRLVSFILNWEKCNGEKYIQNSLKSRKFEGAYTRLRALTLTEEELVDFLKIMGEREFTAWIDDTGEQEWKVTQESPYRRLKISGVRDGLEVKLEKMPHVESSDTSVYFDRGKIHLVPKAQEGQAKAFTDCLEQLPGNWAFIQKSHVPVFVRELFPELKEKFNCQIENFPEQLLEVSQASYEVYLDLTEENQISCQAYGVYGEEKFSVFDNRAEREKRDLPGELEFSALLCRFFDSYDSEKQRMLLGEEEEKIYGLLTEGISMLQEHAQVYISETMKRIQVTEPPKVRFGISFASGILEFLWDVEGMERELFLEILERYHPRKKYYRLKDGSFLDLNDEQIRTFWELKNDLGLSEKELERERISLPSYRALYLDGKLKENHGLAVSRDREFRALIRNMKTAGESAYEIPGEQEHILKEYQKQGYLWMKTLRQYGFGGILADDMGLGKTLQTITFLWSEYLERGEGENTRTLVVTPSSLVYNWVNELEKFAPGLPVKAVVGTAKERKEIIEQAGQNDVLVSSYELLRRDGIYYEGIPFACEIIDEAQCIKNQGTQSARAVKGIHSSFRMALTGTPIENRLSELWSIFDYLMPGFLYSYERFKKELEQPIVQLGQEEKKVFLQKLIRPFVLRRMKKDVLKELPDKLEKDIFSGMEEEQKQLYQAHVEKLQYMITRQTEREFRASRFQILSQITKLRQICCHPGLVYEDYKADSGKLEICMELIRNSVQSGHKVLLFSQFTSMIHILSDKLNEEQISYYVLTGSTSKEERERLVRAFNKDETSVFCISLKAGGTGLNLTAADIVIHYDPWWNLAVQNQATDRAHRIGQRNVVSVYRLFARGTIEENIKKLQEQKRALADEILSGEGMDHGVLTRRELLELL